MFELRKIGIVKRASALLLDAILLMVLTTGFIFIISLISKFDHHQKLANEYYNEWEGFRKDYAGDVAEYYGFVYKEDGENYTVEKDGNKSDLDAVFTKLGKSNGEFDSSIPNFEKVAEAYDVYMALTPAAKVEAQYKLVESLLFMMISIGLLLSYIVLEFILPLILKNGQTVGKKVFGIALVRVDCVKITTLALFARTILGKFTIETMFPVFLIYMLFFGGLGFISIILLAAMAILNIVLFFATKNKTPIHDLLAGTVAVDMKLQMIFQSEEELIQKKSLAAKDEAEKAKW